MAKRILVVDDQFEMLRLIGLNLESKGYEIEAAQDAPTALEKIRLAPPDLVILDVMLPGMSGVDLLKKLRADPSTDQLPIIILSAMSEVEDKIAGLRAGADEYLTKPIDVRELVARVAAILERSERLRQAAGQTRGQVVAFQGATGGVGTTMLTLNTGAALARTGASVIALSLDPAFSSLRNQLGLRESEGARNLLQAEPAAIRVETLRRALSPHGSGIRVFSVPADPEGQAAPGAEWVRRLLEAAVQEAAFVLVDLRPAANDVSRAVLERCDQVLLIAEPTPVCFDAAKAAAAHIRRSAGMARFIACVLVNRSSIAASLTAGDFQKHLDLPIVASVPQSADSLASAYRRGQLILFDQVETTVGETVRGIAATLARTAS